MKSKRRSMRKSSKRSMRKSSSKKMMTTKCKKFLSRKISWNMKEMKKGKYKSRGQAIAVAYSQLKKKYPSCKKYLKIR